MWRGSWNCDACPARISSNEYSGVKWNVPGRVRAPLVWFPREAPAGAAARAPLFSSSEGHKCGSSRAGWKTWLETVELYTSFWRRSRAARHRLKAGSAWHRDREKGQAERFERVATCGAVRWVLQRHDSQGTRERKLEQRCDCWRVCQRCLDRRRWKLKTGIEQQRERAFELHARQRARWYRGAEGRWSERLITLTVPHGETPAHDARLLTKAWRELSARIAQHLKKDRDADGAKPVWVRALEVEPGAGGGHAHLHVWWFGPFLDHAWLRVTWGRILESMGAKCPQLPWREAQRKAVDARFSAWGRTRRGRNGRDPETVPWPIVDVRSARDAGAGEYAQKVGVVLYVAKGSKGVSQRVHPLHAATVYQALESARAVQWARGWAPPKVAKPDGVTYSRRRLSDDERAEEHARHLAMDEAALERLRAATKPPTVVESQAPPSVAAQLTLLV